MRKCDAVLVEFVRERNASCTKAAFIAKAQECYVKLADGKAGKGVLDGLIALDRGDLIRAYFERVPTKECVKDRHVGEAYVTLRSDDTIDALHENQQRPPGWGALLHIVEKRDAPRSAVLQAYEKLRARFPDLRPNMAVLREAIFIRAAPSGEGATREQFLPDEALYNRIIADIPTSKRIINDNFLYGVFALLSEGGRVVAPNLPLLDRMMNQEGFVVERAEAYFAPGVKQPDAIDSHLNGRWYGEAVDLWYKDYKKLRGQKRAAATAAAKAGDARRARLK